MNYKTKKLPSITVMGIEKRLDNSDPQKFAELWDRFDSEIVDKIPNKIGEEKIGLYTEYESDHTGHFNLFVGCPVKPGTKPPEGLVVKEIPEKTFATIPLNGPMPQSLIDAWQWVWEGHLPRSFDYDVEIYGPKSELCIGIQD